ncbi:MHYT domain-containing protein [Octadecabacter antarcticus]|uniref:MHYT domain-containing protein n=1 Tax=Octadecabacter antarcticus TaxID=1217908 RepID=UPI0001805DC3|nr:MHYT domain-containing protein [Octadecabacter antarcticus]
MLEHGHNVYLVIASLAIALMSGFTGLTLTQGASAMGVARRKLLVSMSAVALGGGIWSMHFVAMLGMTLPVTFHYNALVTMMSAFVAILLTGIALLLVHFGERTPKRITFAGLCVAVGILAMHYLGMSGIQGVKPLYSGLGIVVAVVVSLVLCTASFWISYGNRGSRNILFGTLVFGTTVVAVHYIAMAGTHFVKIEGVQSSGLWLSKEVLAFGVTLSSFVISGAFLLVGVTFAASLSKTHLEDSAKQSSAADTDTEAPVSDSQNVIRIPYESDGKTSFVDSNDVVSVQAEGRYTFLYHPTGRLFCPWSISVMETRLAKTSFVKGHRSFLINTDHVTLFERKKDNGVCFFDGTAHLDQAPVSRSYLKEVRKRLGV